MKLSGVLLAILITACATAQNQAQPQTPAPQTAPPQQNWVAQNWFPQAVESLGQNASSRTEFSLDHNMVVLASKMDQEDDSMRRVIAGLDGVSVHRFKFQGPGMYDPQLVNAIRADYHSAGWQHLADAHDRYGYPQGTDLWLRFDNSTIRNIAFLITRADQVAFVSVSGSISPIDLLHLAGHFGIPTIQGGVVVQDPGAASGSYPPNTPEPSASVPPPVDNRSAAPDDDYRHEPAPQTSSPSTTPN